MSVDSTGDKRCEVKIIFDDPRELEYYLPLNIMNRRIVAVLVDGVRFVPQRKRHDEDFTYLTD